MFVYVTFTCVMLNFKHILVIHTKICTGLWQLGYTISHNNETLAILLLSSLKLFILNEWKELLINLAL